MTRRLLKRQKLIKDGKFPVKEDFHEFLRKLYDSKHIPDDEDAELVTRFEMQRFCPDILITNYSMLEYMLLRPIESKIWADTQNWLNADSNNKLLFVIDEAHMYRGSAGGEVSFLIRRLFHRLGIDRSRVQFILTTASMPNKNEADRRVIQTFANDLTASDDGHEFHYLAGQQEEIRMKQNGMQLTLWRMQVLMLLKKNLWNCSTHGYYPPAITQSSLDTQLRIRPARKYGQIMWDTVSRKIRSFRPVYEK